MCAVAVSKSAVLPELLAQPLRVNQYEIALKLSLSVYSIHNDPILSSKIRNFTRLYSRMLPFPWQHPMILHDFIATTNRIARMISHDAHNVAEEEGYPNAHTVCNSIKMAGYTQGCDKATGIFPTVYLRFLITQFTMAFWCCLHPVIAMFSSFVVSFVNSQICGQFCSLY